MKKNKVIVDRKKLSAEEINKHQDFENVLNSSLASSKPFWKKIWFYGPVGIATIGVLFTLGVEVLSPEFEKEEEKKVNESVLDIDALEDTECIHKPVKELDVEYKVFDFQNEEGGTFTLESGTKIIIHKNAIEAKKGNLKLKVRELNTESDKFLSGVKMDIGSDEAFESNGMVELLVVDQNGTDCSLNKEKKILEIFDNAKNQSESRSSIAEKVSVSMGVPCNRKLVRRVLNEKRSSKLNKLR